MKRWKDCRNTYRCRDLTVCDKGAFNRKDCTDCSTVSDFEHGDMENTKRRHLYDKPH